MIRLILAAMLMVPGFAQAQVQLQPPGAPRAAAQPAAAASAAPDKKAAKKDKKGGNIGFNSNSKEPISIDADKLEVFDKEQRAVYSGNVVAVQGQSGMRCTVLTIFYSQAEESAGKGAKRGGDSGSSRIKKLDCAGPVSVTTKKEDGNVQNATGKHGVYEADKETITLTGDVILVDGPNVQRGDQLVYNTETGVAVVTGGRVSGFFIPGSETKKADDKKADDSKKQPAAGKKQDAKTN